MTRAKIPSGGAAEVPSFHLYGEAAAQDLPDIVHVEALRHRSQQHDWRIKPHRHADLRQIFWFQTADVIIDLDGRVRRTDAPTILFVPPRAVHAFSFSPEVAGTVTTIPEEILPPGVSAGDQPIILPAGAALFGRVAAVLAAIEQEFRERHAARERVILSLLDLAFAWAARALSETAPPRGARRQTAEHRAGAFLALVEERFAEGWRAQDYAARVGVSKAQLSRDCHSVLGRSPMQLVHDRLLKEANRKLAYTPQSISDIAETLGFADLGYFSRFYRERRGETPSQYRSRIRSRRGQIAGGAADAPLEQPGGDRTRAAAARAR